MKQTTTQTISLEKYYTSAGPRGYRIVVPPKEEGKNPYFAKVYIAREKETQEQLEKRAIQGFKEYVEKAKKKLDGPDKVTIMVETL